MKLARFFPRESLVVFLIVSLVACFGCGGKKAAPKQDYGKPTWLTLDKSKFVKLSSDETNLEGGTVTVNDPEGWDRMPPGSAKPPKGFKSVIVFQKGGATLMMTKSKTAKDMPDLDEENIEGFAESAQQLFKAPVKMLKLGSIVGVMFSKQVADKNRISKKYNRRIVATSINGQLFTYELVSDDKITDAMLGALYAVISKTKIEGVEMPSDEPETVVAAAGSPKEEPKEESKAETKPTAEEKPVAAAEAKEEPQAEEKPVVAAAPKEEPKVEPKAEEKPIVAAAPKEEKKPAAKPAKPAKDKKNTKAILDELDSLLN